MANNKANQQYKIGLDCRLGGHAHAGIGRYIASIASRLPTLGPNFHFYFFCYDKNQAVEIVGDKTPENVTIVLAPIKHYTVAEQLMLPKIFTRYYLDLLHIPHFNAPLFYSGKIVITIHDLLWHDHTGTAVTTLPKWQYWLKYLGYKLVAGSAIRKAATILVPTTTVKETLNRFYPHSAAKTSVTSEGVDENWFSPLNKDKKKKQLVYVGSLYPHKNIKVVLEALRQLPTFQLILVGSRNVFQDAVKKTVRAMSLEKKVSFLGFKPDSELKKTLQQSTALLQPSLSEGFGLTGLEAMATGTQVIASDIPVFKEVYGKYAHYFDPNNPQTLVSAVTGLKPIAASKLQVYAKSFSWETTAIRVIAEYKRALTQKRK